MLVEFSTRAKKKVKYEVMSEVVGYTDTKDLKIYISHVYDNTIFGVFQSLENIQISEQLEQRNHNQISLLLIVKMQI